MTEKEIQLLLQDLSSRLRYGVRLCVPGHLVSYKLLGIDGDVLHIDTPVYDEGDGYFELDCFNIKPYLRPMSMSSMTDKERKEYYNLCFEEERKEYEYGDWVTRVYYHDTVESVDWLNAHHFDCRGLIEKGLAIEVTEERNPYKTEE